jgi:hypothetical protein
MKHASRGGGREIENTETESLSAAARGDWREETLTESPPEGSSIPPSASPSTPPSRSAPLHHHLLQDLIIPTVISWQTWCMIQYTRFPWSIVFLCPCLSSNLLLAILKFFVDWLHKSLLSSMWRVSQHRKQIFLLRRRTRTSQDLIYEMQNNERESLDLHTLVDRIAKTFR